MIQNKFLFCEKVFLLLEHDLNIRYDPFLFPRVEVVWLVLMPKSRKSEVLLHYVVLIIPKCLWTVLRR